MSRLLLIVDPQIGFTNNTPHSVIYSIQNTCNYFMSMNWPIAITKFRNDFNSPFQRLLDWDQMSSGSNTSISENIIPPEALKYSHVFTKTFYTAFTKEFETFVMSLGINQIVVCGFDTDGCVLKSCLDAFERNIRPILLSDACYSSHGETSHIYAVRLLERLIGIKQISSCQQIISKD